MIKLSGAPLSGNAYKVRLLLSLLGLEFEETDVNLQTGENRTESFLALNPRGQIPTLPIERLIKCRPSSQNQCPCQSKRPVAAVSPPR